MAVLEDLLSAVRRELNDQPTPFTWSILGDGATTAYTIGYKPLDPASISVTVDGTPIPQPTGYTVDSVSGTIIFAEAPASGSTVRVSGNFFRYFNDEDLTSYINTAVTQHTYNKTDQFGSTMTLSKIPPIEEYPLAILATIEALWAIATDASFDIDITAPDGVHIPRSQRFAQITGMIAQRQQQYKDLCAALNIGVWRIEMGILRRVSRTTNKLVPVYMPQEIDDSRRPERVYLQNDLYGRTPAPSVAQVYDIVFTQGDSWSAIFDFPFDLTGYTVKAQIRTYPNSPALYATFTVEYTDRPAGKVRLSLTKSQTAYLPRRAFWDLQITSDADPTWEHTFIKGQVFIDSQVTLD